MGPERSALLSTPNNNLGWSNLRALDRMGSAIRPCDGPRGGGPDSLLVGETPPEVPSATQLRAFGGGGSGRRQSPISWRWCGGPAAELGMPSLRRVGRGLLARLGP